MNTKTQTYTSGRDFLGMTLFWGLIVGFYVFITIRSDIFSSFGNGQVKNSILDFSIYQGVWILIFLFFFWLFKSIKYEISADELTIKMLGTESKILISKIEKITRTYNPLAAPALSIRRIWIITKGNKYAALISPTNERDFLAELLRRNPNIELRNLKSN
jgi:hypothetical protein